MFRHDCPLAVKPASTPRRLVQNKTNKQKNCERFSTIDMLLSTVSVLVVAQPSSEVPEGLMNYPVFYVRIFFCPYILFHFGISFNQIVVSSLLSSNII